MIPANPASSRPTSVNNDRRLRGMARTSLETTPSARSDMLLGSLALPQRRRTPILRFIALPAPARGEHHPTLIARSSCGMAGQVDHAPLPAWLFGGHRLPLFSWSPPAVKRLPDPGLHPSVNNSSGARHRDSITVILVRGHESSRASSGRCGRSPTVADRARTNIIGGQAIGMQGTAIRCDIAMASSPLTAWGLYASASRMAMLSMTGSSSPSTPTADHWTMGRHRREG